MSDDDLTDDEKDRHTDEAASFLRRARKAAQDKVIEANQQRTNAIKAANLDAHATLTAAHNRAADILGQNLQSVLLLTDQEAVLVDAHGGPSSRVRSAGAANLAVDAAAKRIYWAHAGWAAPVGGAANLPPAPQTTTDDLQHGDVALFEHYDYGGRVWVFNRDVRDFRLFPGLNDQVSSVKVGPNTGCTLYEHVEFQGRRQSFGESIPVLGGTDIGNDTASSLQIPTPERIRDVPVVPRRGQVVLYEENDFQGRCWKFSADVSDFRHFDGLNDAVSSVRVGPDTAVTLFEHVDFQGRWMTFQGDFAALADTGFGDGCASSLRLSGRRGGVAPGHVMLYEHYDFQGRTWLFNGDVPDFRSFAGLNDQISSVRVGPETAVTLYAHVAHQGNSQVITNDTPNLSVTAVGNDAASSLRVQAGLPQLQLVSTALDGSNSVNLAGVPADVANASSAGSVALDTGAHAIFWILPWGTLMRADMGGGALTKVLDLGGGSAASRWGIALDTVNKRVYWSSSRAIGVVGYDGSQPHTLLTGPWDGPPVPAAEALPSRVAVKPPAAPPVRIAVDARNVAGNGLFWNTGSGIWRSNLDGTNPVKVRTPPLSSAGLAFDAATALLYWGEGGSTMRATSDSIDTPEVVFAIPPLHGSLLDLDLLTTAGAATQRLQDAQSTRQQAQASAAGSVDQAHQTAIRRREDAQTNLRNAHTQSTQSVADKQQDAAARRQRTQDEVQQAYTTATQRVREAKTNADARRTQANIDAGTIKSEARAQAETIKKPAQDKLGDARRQKQQS